MLSNIFLHHVLDKWFEDVVRPRMRGKATLVRTNRHRPAREQHAWLSAVINGHYAYYGITGNHRRLQEYRHQVVKIWRKWLERRTRGWLLIWANFNAFLARHPLPVARIIHRYTSWNESLS
jgi:hypothetical protein